MTADVEAETRSQHDCGAVPSRRRRSHTPSENAPSSSAVFRRLTALTLIVLLCGITACTGPSACTGPPDWISRRPHDPGYLYGVGHCGRTYIPGDARKTAVERAARELYQQAWGPTGFQFRCDEDHEEGGIAVAVIDGDRQIDTMTELEIVEEMVCCGRHGLFDEGTVLVLVRMSEKALRGR